MPLIRWPKCAGGATVCFDFAFRCLCCCGLWRRALVSGVGKMETVFCACCGVCAVCCCCCILRWLWDRGVVSVRCVVAACYPEPAPTPTDTTLKLPSLTLPWSCPHPHCHCPEPALTVTALKLPPMSVP